MKRTPFPSAPRGARTLLAASLLLHAAAPPASAATQFGDGVVVDSNIFFGSAGGFSGGPTTATVSRSSFPWSASATTWALSSRLEVESVATRAPQPGSSGYASGRGTPSLRLEDLVISKLPGQEALPDTLTAELAIDVDYVTSATGGTASNTFDLLGGINESSMSLASYTGSTSATIVASKTLTVGVPFFVKLSVDQRSSISGFYGGTVTGTSTVRLDAARFLDLPPGYTVDGAEGYVADNRLAPEAPALGGGGRLALAAALLGLALRLARRRIG